MPPAASKSKGASSPPRSSKPASPWRSFTPPPSNFNSAFAASASACCSTLRSPFPPSALSTARCASAPSAESAPMTAASSPASSSCSTPWTTSWSTSPPPMIPFRCPSAPSTNCSATVPARSRTAGCASPASSPTRSAARCSISATANALSRSAPFHRCSSPRATAWKPSAIPPSAAIPPTSAMASSGCSPVATRPSPLARTWPRRPSASSTASSSRSTPNWATTASPASVR